MGCRRGSTGSIGKETVLYIGRWSLRIAENKESAKERGFRRKSQPARAANHQASRRWTQQQANRDVVAPERAHCGNSPRQSRQEIRLELPSRADQIRDSE